MQKLLPVLSSDYAGTAWGGEVIHGGKRTLALAKISPLDGWLNIVGGCDGKYDHPNGHCTGLKCWREIEACANADFVVFARAKS